MHTINSLKCIGVAGSKEKNYCDGRMKSVMNMTSSVEDKIGVFKDVIVDQENIIKDQKKDNKDLKLLVESLMKQLSHLFETESNWIMQRSC